jgi:ATP-dependent DNA helicase RecG
MDGRFIIDNLLRQEKNERLDFLPKATEDILAKVITAMLNDRGGDIVIGVDDNKRVIGVSDGDLSNLPRLWLTGYVHRLLLTFILLIIMELTYCL